MSEQPEDKQASITAEGVAEMALSGVKAATKAVSKFALGFTQAIREGAEEAREDLGLPAKSDKTEQ